MGKIYSILIVEDESLERKALTKIIQDNFQNEAVCQSVEDYGDVLEVVATLKPDIIFMDIHLGSVNGIELSKQIMMELPNIRIIILTAYDFSHYSRQAVSIGVKEFLLKPAVPINIVNAVKKQINNLNDEREKFIKMTQDQKNITKVMPLLESHLINGLWYDILSPNEIKEYLELIGMRFAGVYSMAIQVEKDMAGFKYYQKAILLEKVLDIIHSKYKGNVLMHQINPSMILAIFFLDSVQEEYMERTRNIDIAQHIRIQLMQRFDVKVHFGISTEYKEYGSIARAVQESKIALYRKNEAICHYSDLMLPDVDYCYSKADEKLILCSVAKDDKDALNDSFYKLFNGVSAFGIDTSKKAITRLLINIINEYSELIFTSNDTVKELFSAGLVELVQATSFSEVEMVSLNMINEINESLCTRYGNNSINIINKAKEYINNRFSEDISLEEIAKNINISQCYLSRMFKNLTNENISQYIIRVRLDCSKKLLIETDKQIKEISNESGFNDPNYFCKVFRRVIGMSPSEYRSIKV